jgi:hypothetical protein
MRVKCAYSLMNATSKLGLLAMRLVKETRSQNGKPLRPGALTADARTNMAYQRDRQPAVGTVLFLRRAIIG